jgi:beta-xylosidase
MQEIRNEVKTPHKYGIVIEPPAGKKVDCPAVFRYGHKWYMVYVQFEAPPSLGYTTQLAESSDLLHWKPLGTILDRGAPSAWDRANAAGGLALIDTKWNGGHTLQTYQGSYWLSYIGGKTFGYEQTPLWIGMASTKNPSVAVPWQKMPSPVLTTQDADVRAGLETQTLYKSFVFRDPANTLGAPFVMFYNAKGTSEQIYTAISNDLKIWKRYGAAAAVENQPPAGSNHGVISGDPQIVRLKDVWVMFYFGAFWKPGAFNTFAASYDLVHWTKWQGDNLISPSEPYDARYAHKPWFLKYHGVVYQFYCAVSADKDEHRTIALATSKVMNK